MHMHACAQHPGCPSEHAASRQHGPSRGLAVCGGQHARLHVTLCLSVGAGPHGRTLVVVPPQLDACGGLVDDAHAARRAVAQAAEAGGWRGRRCGMRRRLRLQLGLDRGAARRQPVSQRGCAATAAWCHGKEEARYTAGQLQWHVSCAPVHIMWDTSFATKDREGCAGGTNGRHVAQRGVQRAGSARCAPAPAGLDTAAQGGAARAQEGHDERRLQRAAQQRRRSRPLRRGLLASAPQLPPGCWCAQAACSASLEGLVLSCRAWAGLQSAVRCSCSRCTRTGGPSTSCCAWRRATGLQLHLHSDWRWRSYTSSTLARSYCRIPHVGGHMKAGRLRQRCAGTVRPVWQPGSASAAACPAQTGQCQAQHCGPGSARGQVSSTQLHSNCLPKGAASTWHDARLWQCIKSECSACL